MGDVIIFKPREPVRTLLSRLRPEPLGKVLPFCRRQSQGPSELSSRLPQAVLFQEGNQPVFVRDLRLLRKRRLPLPTSSDDDGPETCA